jgi:hypothetical protein
MQMVKHIMNLRRKRNIGLLGLLLFAFNVYSQQTDTIPLYLSLNDKKIELNNNFNIAFINFDNSVYCPEVFKNNFLVDYEKLLDSFQIFFKYDQYDFILDRFYKKNKLFLGGFIIEDTKKNKLSKSREFYLGVSHYGVVKSYYFKRKKSLLKIFRLIKKNQCSSCSKLANSHFK